MLVQVMLKSASRNPDICQERGTEQAVTRTCCRVVPGGAGCALVLARQPLGARSAGGAVGGTSGSHVVEEAGEALAALGAGQRVGGARQARRRCGEAGNTYRSTTGSWLGGGWAGAQCHTRGGMDLRDDRNTLSRCCRSKRRDHSLSPYCQQQGATYCQHSLAALTNRGGDLSNWAAA